MEANVTAALVPYTPFTYLGGAAAAAPMSDFPPVLACLTPPSHLSRSYLPAYSVRSSSALPVEEQREETTYLAFLALPNQEESEEADGREGNSKG